jgi:two-component system chemotaxis response regulator CheY
MACILIVDDNLSVQLTLEFCLQDAGYSVVLAGDGPAALRTAAEEQVDLILLDVNMPLMNGLAVCQALKSNQALSHIPVVMMTSCPTRETVSRAIAAGAVEMMPKPFALTQLYAIISRNLPGAAKSAEMPPQDTNRIQATGFPPPSLRSEAFGFGS